MCCQGEAQLCCQGEAQLCCQGEAQLRCGFRALLCRSTWAGCVASTAGCGQCQTSWGGVSRSWTASSCRCCWWVLRAVGGACCVGGRLHAVVESACMPGCWGPGNTCGIGRARVERCVHLAACCVHLAGCCAGRCPAPAERRGQPYHLAVLRAAVLGVAADTQRAGARHCSEPR